MEQIPNAHHQTSLVAQLHSELRNLRQAYLSTAAPRKTHLHTSARNGSSQPVYLTDRDREEIDANAKATLRDLNARIRALEDAEQLRQSTETALIQKKYARGLGALGSWAAGGGPLGSSKSKEHAAAEAVARQLGAHRESVIWYLRQRLQETARTQQAMMETRLTREMEKNRSVLAKARSSTGLDTGNHFGSRRRSGSVVQGNTSHLPVDEYERKSAVPTQDLTDEQIQMFEKGNQDMVKHFESTLDKVRYGTCLGRFLRSTPGTNCVTGPLNNHCSRFPNCKICWSAISQLNRRILTSLLPSLSRPPRASTGVTRSSRRALTGPVQLGIPSSLLRGSAPSLLYGI